MKRRDLKGCSSFGVLPGGDPSVASRADRCGSETGNWCPEAALHILIAESLFILQKLPYKFAYKMHLLLAFIHLLRLIFSLIFLFLASV